jgi:hypothetical protein
MARPKRPICVECRAKPARKVRVNDDGPYWCSKACAVEWAVMRAGCHLVWCQRHAEWSHPDDGCYECELAGCDCGIAKSMPGYHSGDCAISKAHEGA